MSCCRATGEWAKEVVRLLSTTLPTSFVAHAAHITDLPAGTNLPSTNGCEGLEFSQPRGQTHLLTAATPKAQSVKYFPHSFIVFTCYILAAS